MSLGFTYQPPRKIRIVRHQTIRFFVGHPEIRFRQQYIKPVKKEKPAEVDYVDDLLHESYIEKPKKKKEKTSTAQYTKSFSSCYEILQTIKSKKKLHALYEIRSSNLSLENIEEKLRNCCYNTVNEFFGDLTDFLFSVSDDDSELAHSAKHFLQKVESIPDKMVSAKGSLSFSDLSHQFKHFLDVQIPTLQTVEAKPTISRRNKDLDAIASKLNSLDPQKKLKAEWLVRIHHPNLPYYATGIDLTQLSKGALDALNNFLDEKD